MKIELNNVDTKFNRFQSTLEDIDFFKLPDEVKEQFLECLISIEFIRNLVSVKRPYVQDLPRDEKGRAIIDFTNPPLYENADFFRPTGLLFEKEGILNPYKPNPAKQSDYYKWVGRDVYRSYNGYLNKETGMWIPGDMYWYLNYCMMDSIVEGEDGIEYNRVITPSFWEGQWWRFLGWYEARKQKLNFAEIASRRKGKSSCAAGRGSRDFYLGESQAAQENIKNLYVADSAIYLNKGGVLNLFEKMIDFIAQNTNFAHERLQSSLNDMIWVSGYTDLNTKTKMGSLNQVQGITISDDPDKPRGKAANFIYFEEFGNFGKLQQTYDTTVYSVKQGKKTRGLVVLAGTGGTRGANFQGALDMIYNPKAMGILPYRNVWDTNQTDNSIFFFPAYVNYEGCINKDGISDVTASLKEILLYRHSKKYGTASPSSLAQAIAEQPITIQDSIMKTDESIFPTAAITERILDIDKNPNSLSDIYVGVMVLNSNGEAEFRPTADTPIRQYPHTAGEKRPGAIEIIEMPIKDKDGKIPYGRYISSCLKKGERVNTAVGLKAVEDVTINDTLIDIDGNESKIKRIIQKYNIFPVYKVKLWSIYDTTTFTKDHPIYCSTPKRKYNGIRKVRELGLPERYWVNNFNFRKVEDLKVGDVVKVPNLYNKEKPFLHFWKDDSRIDRKISNPLDKEEFWWFIGFLLGDGWCSKNGYTITICLNVVDENYYEKIEHIVKTLFKRNFCYSRQRGKIKNLMFSYKYLNSFIIEHFSKYAKNKQIPEWAKYIPNNLKKQLVLGYLASDGCITKENYAEFVSVSKKLLCDIQDILFSMGVRSSLTKMRGREVHTINNHVSKTKPTYHLRCYLLDTEKIVNWDRTDLKCSRYTYVPTNPNRKRDVKNVYFSDDLNYIYFKVYKIDIEKYEGPVYNFECDTHTFMCNYIPTHNCDPVDDDSTNTDTLSLQSFFMFDLWTDTIVAEYTGRTEFAVDFYEQTRLLNAFYNAKMMYENNKKGVFSYYQRMHSLKYMAETPEYLKSKGLQPRYNIGNKAYGIHNIGSINATGLEFLRDWLCSPVTIYIPDPEDESKVKETEVMRLYTLKNRAFLQELAKYNPVGNYDRISSMIMLMLYREEKLIVKGFSTWEQLNSPQNENGEDPTFFNEYERRHKKQSKVFSF